MEQKVNRRETKDKRYTDITQKGHRHQTKGPQTSDKKVTDIRRKKKKREKKKKGKQFTDIEARKSFSSSSSFFILFYFLLLLFCFQLCPWETGTEGF